MQQERNEFKVGLTVAVVAALFVAVLFFVGRWEWFFQRTQHITVRFAQPYGVEGLRAKDPVRVGGVNVGRVFKVWLEDSQVSPADSKRELYAFVGAEIPADITLYTDARVTIGTRFVGEGGTLDILDTGGKGEKLTAKKVITGVPPASLTEVTEKLSRELDEENPDSLILLIKRQLDKDNPGSIVGKILTSLNDINTITADIRNQVSPDEQANLVAKLHEVMNNANAVTQALRNEFNRSEEGSTLAQARLALDSLNSSLKRVHETLVDAQPKVGSAITHVETTAKRFDEDISAPLARELDSTAKDSLLAHLHALLSEAGESMDNLKTTTSTIKETVLTNHDSIQALIDDLSETGSQLKATAKEVRRNPWRLLYKPTKGEVEYADLMETARAFSDSAFALDRANNKLKEILQMHPEGVPADHPELAQIREQLKQTFCQFEEEKNKLWDLLKKADR
jgi:ABC-type transporter Mla subunit MlaD